MGFRKTPKGNLIYDFDFTPKKLVPLNPDECGYERCYAVEGANGQRAPVLITFQGERHPNYGLAFCFMTDEARRANAEMLQSADAGHCVFVTNAPVVTTLIRLLDGEYDHLSTDFIDPWSTRSLSKEGLTFPIPSLDESEKFLREHSLPKDGYAMANSL